MKTFYRVAVLVFGVTAPAALTSVLSSCGGDDTGTPPTMDDGSSDGTVESRPDVGADAVSDRTVTDTGKEASPEAGGDGDAATGDANATKADADATAADADAGTQDADAQPTNADADAQGMNPEAAGPDADAQSPDADAAAADADAQAVEAEAAAPEAGPDAAYLAALYGFPGKLVAALCNQAAVCCFGDASANFDTTQCESSNLANGFNGSSQGLEFLDGGNVIYDGVKGQACLDDFGSIDCRTDQLTTSDMMQLFPNCFGALVGTLPVNAPCKGNIECAPGEFCSPAGTCQTLRGAGGSCADFYGDGGQGFSGSLQTNSQGICSYRGSGNTNLFCNYEDWNTGNPLPVDAGWTCLPAVDAGAQCINHQDCTSRVCVSPAFTCGQATAFFNTFGCNHYKKDGG